MSTKLDQIIKQLDCMNPVELSRLARAVKVDFCAQDKSIPSVVDMFGYVGMLMNIQWAADWEAEKILPITEPKP